MHAVTQYVETLLQPFLGPELVRVDERLGSVSLGLEIVVDGGRAKGIVIGEKGETITAIRHLAARLGKISQPRVRTSIEVVAEGERER